MGFLSSLFGGGSGSVPKYDMNAAKDAFKWQQNQARYGVNNGLAGLSWDPQSNTQNITYGAQMQGLIDTLFGGTGADQRAEQSVFSSFQNRYQPLFERQSDQLQDRLKNQGIPVGSEAYARAVKDLAQNQNDATLQAANQAAATGRQARANEISQGLGIFSAFNPLSSYTPGAGTPNIDLYGNQFAADQYTYAQNSANATAKNRGIWDLIQAGAGVAAGELLKSDARLKENLTPVGELYNGLTVWAFNFKGEDVTRIGLVAQEVQEVVPLAVREDAEGLLAVDYALASGAVQIAQTQEQGGENENGEFTD